MSKVVIGLLAELYFEFLQLISSLRFGYRSLEVIEKHKFEGDKRKYAADNGGGNCGAIPLACHLSIAGGLFISFVHLSFH